MSASRLCHRSELLRTEDPFGSFEIQRILPADLRLRAVRR
jgi:hypothetical protein